MGDNRDYFFTYLEEHRLLNLDLYILKNNELVMLDVLSKEIFKREIRQAYPNSKSAYEAYIYRFSPLKDIKTELELMQIKNKYKNLYLVSQDYESNSFVRMIKDLNKNTAPPIPLNVEVNVDLQKAQSNNQLLSQKLHIKDQQINQLQTENQTLKQRIAELEAQLAAAQAQTAKENFSFEHKPVAAILDADHPKHAPDLAHAVNLWLALYGDSSANDTDSHSNRAFIWIKQNTGYPAIEDNSSVKRIREICTPLSDWGGQRPRENKQSDK